MAARMPSGNFTIAAQHGFSYLAVLLAITIIGISLASTGMVWHTTVRQERELELLFVGNQYRQAIGSFYSASPGPVKQYPQTIDDLLRDPRSPGVVRHLRKAYHDPITGSPDWGLIRNRNGQIIGVHSLSIERPLKQANFSGANRNFAKKDKYSDWLFTHLPSVPSAGANRPRGASIPPTPSGVHN